VFAVLKFFLRQINEIVSDERVFSLVTGTVARGLVDESPEVRLMMGKERPGLFFSIKVFIMYHVFN